MISAELSHRDYVDSWTIAMTFARLKFHGNKDIIKPLNNLAYLIEHKEERKNEVKIEVLKTAKNNNDEKITLLNAELKDLRNRLIAMIINKDIRSKINQIKTEIRELESMNYKIYRLIEEIEELDNKWQLTYRNYTELNAFRNLLAKLGFVQTTSHGVANSSLQHEFYQYTGNEEELKQLATIKLAAEKADLEKRCDNIRINYAKKLANNELPSADNVLDELSSMLRIPRM